MARFEDRLTAHAESVLRVARAEALYANLNHAGTEQLLLAVAVVDEGAAPAVLREVGLTVEAIRGAVTSIVGTGAWPVEVVVDLTPAAEQLMQRAVAEAGACGHNRVSPDHIFLVITRDAGSVARQALEALGVRDFGELRERVLARIREPGDERPDR